MKRTRVAAAKAALDFDAMQFESPPPARFDRRQIVFAVEPMANTLRRSCPAIRQKIDRPVSIQVDQDCSIALTLFPSPVIHAKNFDLRADNRTRPPFQYPQNRIRAGIDTEFGGELKSSFATQSVAVEV